MEFGEETKITFRPFEKSDLGDVLGIERLSFTNPWSSNMFEALNQISPKGFYVVLKQGIIVAYAIFLPEQSLRHWSRKKTAHLLNLAVHPQVRNQGIGKSLIHWIISNLKDIKVKEIYLEVRTSNTNAIAFYTRLGFARIGLIEGFYGDEDAIVMVKKI
ncbi:MAG: ribosomal protein S18-alanine N-acetyltransferase [Thermoplasmata archaeon]|nr:MAG: ribosomal protein S18-alanine N-acetyltransferase [Thermoplasmata archaeon]